MSVQRAENETTAAKPKSDFRALIVYPNLPLMLVPGVAIGLFTRILKDQGYGVDMFETTHYDTDETNYSETKINYSENRVRLLNVRKFDVEKDLDIDLKQDMLGDFRAKVQDFKPDILLFSVVEDTFFQALTMLDAVTSFIFTPYHGTALRKVPEAHGWIDPDVVTVHNTSRSLLKMPPPYLSADDIDGLIMTLPLYCYFPKSEWENLKRAEKPDEEGLKIRKYYSDIYSENFLNEHQDMAKTFFGEGEGVVAADLRADFRISPERMTPVVLSELMSPMVGH